MTRLADDALAELALLAGEATPGPWHHRGIGQVMPRGPWTSDPWGSNAVCNVPAETNTSRARADAAYIAAVDPSTVAALVAEVQALRAALADAATALDRTGIHVPAERARRALDGAE